MIDVLRAELTPDELGYNVGFDEADFRAAGLDPYFFFTEYGTSRMAAQPCIGPAGDQELPVYLRELRAALRP
jgi:hypothetical protein